jgi:type I restriction enzyme, S subunit
VRLVPEGSVAIVVRSGILVRTLPVAFVPFSVALNQDMKAVVPRAGIDSRWVAWGMRIFGQAILREARKSGTTVASLDTARLMRFRLPIPSRLADQQQIVSRIEGYLTRLDAGLSSLERVDSLRKNLISATLLRATVGHARVADWDAVTVGDIAKVSTGATPLRARADYYQGGTIPWVTSGLLNKPYIDAVDTMITELALRETSVKLFPPGTLLVAMYGEGRTRGRCSELRISATTNQACAAIQLLPQYSDRREWVKLVLEASYQITRAMAAGGVQPNLSLGLVKSIRVPMPPESLQAEILDEVSRAKASGVRLEQSVISLRSRVAGLRKVVFKSALDDQLPER